MAKKRKKSKSPQPKKPVVPKKNPVSYTVSSSDLGLNESYTSTASSTPETSTVPVVFTPVKSEPKKRFSTKIVSGIVGSIPDGMLIKVLTVITHKLIGKIPEEKRDELWEKGTELAIKLASGVAEGAARGTTSELKRSF